MTEIPQPASPPHPASKRRFPWRLALVAVCFVLAAVAVFWQSTLWGGTRFALKDVPIPDELQVPLPYQSFGAASDEVKRYPQLKSGRPLYGKVQLSPSDRKKRPNEWYYCVADESKGTGTGYDTFYLDANHNLDLTDDPPSRRETVLWARSGIGEVSFSVVTISGAREDGSDLKLEPRASAAPGGGEPFYLAPAFARQGKVEIGDKTYTVILTQSDRASARWDLPSTHARIAVPHTGPVAETDPGGSLESFEGPLSAMYLTNGIWLTLSANSKGDTLTVNPYEGDTGVIRVALRGDTRRTILHDGTFRSRSGMVVQNHGPSFSSEPNYRPLRLPAGEYAPDFIDVRIGQYNVNTRRRCAPGKQDQYSESDYYVKISKDKAYTLKVGSTAEIAFSRPEMELVGKPGEYVNVGWDLVTPALIITEVEHQTAGFLLPTMTVRDSSGNVVAGPFRAADYWLIPKTFVPKDGRETLKITIEWDTKDLFGVVKGEKEIVVESTDTGGGK
jgi:hypothetical protein